MFLHNINDKPQYGIMVYYKKRIMYTDQEYCNVSKDSMLKLLPNPTTVYWIKFYRIITCEFINNLKDDNASTQTT